MRLITHNDFDGVVCAVLITSLEDVDEIMFAEPYEIQFHEIPVSKNDIISDLPFHPKCYLWFDHHLSSSHNKEFKGRFELLPSAARVVYNYYESPYLERFLELINAADKIDSGKLTKEDIINPKGYELLSISFESENKEEDFEYLQNVVEWLQRFPVDKILEFKEVKERCKKRFEEREKFKVDVKNYAKVIDNVLVVDIRGAKNFPKGSDYLLYLLYPECNVSVRIFEKDEFVCVSVGHNIFKRCEVNIGELMKKYKGGGHFSVGGCALKKHTAEKSIAEIIEALREKNG